MEQARHEAADREKRKFRVILRRFPMAPGETLASLADAIENTLLTQMELQGEIAMMGHRLPKGRDKAGPPHVLLTFGTLHERALFLSRRKRLQGSPWSLDDDLTPAQQHQRRELWPHYIRLKQSESNLPIHWRGGDLYVKNQLWTPSSGG